MEWLHSRIARNPRHALVIGKTVFLVGCILILGAAFARAGLANTNEARAATNEPPLHSLAQAYPQYPTWVVPEGPVGYSIAAVLVLAGMGLTVLAEKAGKR